MITEVFSVKSRYYDGAVDTELHIPAGMTTLISDYQSGIQIHYGGYSSILGFIESSKIDLDQFYELNSKIFVSHFNVDDYVYVLIEHIRFTQTHLPESVDPLTFLHCSKLNRYSIVVKTKDTVSDAFVKDFTEGKITKTSDVNGYITKGKVECVIKILNVFSPLDIEICMVTKNTCIICRVDPNQLTSYLEGEIGDLDPDCKYTAKFVKGNSIFNKYFYKFKNKIGL